MTFRQPTGASGASQASGGAPAAAYDELRDTAVAAARAAALVIRRHAADLGAIQWENKATADFVSLVDREAEERVRAVVAERVPGAHVLGEELSPQLDDGTGGGLVFVVDPLDGTTNFLHGYPAYAVSVGVLDGGTLVAGAVLDVPRDELFTATRGGGAYRDGHPIAVSPRTDPAHALVGTGFPFKHLDRLDAYQRQFAAVTRATAGIRRPGSAALDLCAVACGRFEAFWELTLAPWDIAAGLLLVREAGGVVTDLSGRDAEVRHTELVAGSPTMHAWLLDVVRSA